MSGNPSNGVYGGDEVAALVIDPGSHTTRFGFAGEDTPKVILSSYVGITPEASTSGNNATIAEEDVPMEDADAESASNQEQSKSKAGVRRRKGVYFGEENICIPRKDMEVTNTITDGCITDWDSTIEMWDSAFSILRADFSEQPVLMTDVTWNSKENREKAMETIFETFNAPAFFMANNAACTSFAAGKPSSLVVDVGYKTTSVTPIIDGLPLLKNSIHNSFAGGYLNKHVLQMFESLQIDLTPRYLISGKTAVPSGANPIFDIRKRFPWLTESEKIDINNLRGLGITKSFNDYHVEKIIDQFKEEMLEVYSSPIRDPAAIAAAPRTFEFPTGYNREWGSERYTISEYLFRPENAKELVGAKSPTPKSEDKNGDRGDDDTQSDKAEQESKPNTGTATGTATPTTAQPLPISQVVFPPTPEGPLGLSTQVIASLADVDVDVRAQLANNIVVTGGTSLVPHLVERLNNDLTQALPGLKVRVYAPGNTVERKYSSWIGGSILASLGTFHQLWVSRKEYEEEGASKLIQMRFC